MSTAQELLGLLVGAKPSHRYEKPKPAAPKPERVTSLYAEQMPNWIAVELPELGGRADIVSVFVEKRIAIGEMSTREQNLLARIDCERCNQPRLQQLVGRTFAGGEHWSVIPCTSCPLDLRGTR
jgi:hypothetical protein